MKHVNALYSIDVKKKQLHLEDFDVDAKHRGHGLGTQFMRKLMRFAIKEGLRIVLVPASGGEGVDHKKLVIFYSRLGFKRNNRRRLVKSFPSDYFVFNPKSH